MSIDEILEANFRYLPYTLISCVIVGGAIFLAANLIGCSL